jgi:O-acetylhomoserine/O-acetylserine sulfhydrylase-like pyridoxal-dependent enzyme
LLKTNVIFVTDSQSYGGLRTWQELAKYKDITVFGWSNGKPVNVTPAEPEDTHITTGEILSNPEPGDVDILKMKLVAHRKVK